MTPVNELREAFVKEFGETSKATAIARQEREEFTVAVSNFVAGYLKHSTIGAMEVAEGLSNVAQNVYRTFEAVRFDGRAAQEATAAPQQMAIGGRFA